MNKLSYAFRDGWRLIARHPGMSFLTVFTAAAVFFIIGASTLFVLNIRHVVSSMEDKLTIQAYVKDGSDLQLVADQIKKFDSVTAVNLVTKDNALERLRSRIGPDANVVALLGENPLPESVEATVSGADGIKDVADKIEKLEAVDEVIYAGKAAEKLSRVSNFVSHLSMIMLIVAIAASGIVLFNTVRIAIYSKEEEIKTMLMVGSTSTYVAMPFVIQGVLLGLIGALISFGLLVIAYRMAIDRLKDMLPFFHFISATDLIGRLGFLLICCAMAVSLVASLTAVEKFIRKASKSE